MIPGRHGKYDFGSKYYEERKLIIECDLLRKISRSELREIAFLLSNKSQIKIWNEPDKYYVGELSSEVDIRDFPKEAMRSFDLEFICEPFAYSESKELDISTGVNKIEYEGTAETPTRIVLRNNNPYPISNIMITVIKKK